MIEGFFAGVGLFILLVLMFVVLGKFKYAILAMSLIFVCIISWIAWLIGYEINYLLLFVGLPATFAPHVAVFTFGPSVFYKP